MFSYAKPKFVDIDNDGDLDIFIGDANWKVIFFRNIMDNIYYRGKMENNLYDSNISTFSDLTLVDIDNDGHYDLFVGNGRVGLIFYRNLGVDTTTISINYNHEHGRTETLQLTQNYPNPFNPTTKISWQAPMGSWQTSKVYNELGNEVAALLDEVTPAGIYEIKINAANLSSGIYFYRL